MKDGRFDLGEVLDVAREAADSTYDVTRDATEEICIKAVCHACRAGDMPTYRHEDPKNRTQQDEHWIHDADNLFHWWYCDAHAIYEIRRKRAT